MQGSGEPDSPSPEELRDFTSSRGGTAQVTAVANPSDPELNSAQLQSMIAWLESVHPGRLVKHGTSDNLDAGDGQYWLVLTGQLPNSIVARAETLAFDTTILTENPVTATQLDTFTSTLGLEMRRRLGTDFPITVSSGSLGNSLEVRFGGIHESLATVKKAVDEAAVEGLRAVGLDVYTIPLDVVHDPDLVNPDFHVNIKGGVASNGCTTGFTAYRHNVPGIIMADHCGHSLRDYDNQSSIFFYQATKQLFDGGGYIDMMFLSHYEVHESTKQFYVSASEGFKVVTSISDPGASTLCHYGKTTGHSCGTVVDTSMCTTFDPGNVYTCKLAKVRDMRGELGDSGGPCFYATQARGIFTGGGDTFQYCTVISAAQNRLDAYVRRS